MSQYAHQRKIQLSQQSEQVDQLSLTNVRRTPSAILYRFRNIELNIACRSLRMTKRSRSGRGHVT